MKWRLLTTLILGLTLWSGQALGGKTELTFVTLNWAPYAGMSLHKQGITTEIIREACKEADITPHIRFTSWVRALKETRAGTYDVTYNAYFSKERENNYGISDPYFLTQLVLCARADSQVDFDGTTQSLHPYKLGVVQGFVNTEEIDTDTELVKVVAESDAANLRNLLAKRVDVIVIDKYQALHLVKNNPTIEGDASSIRILSPQLELKYIHALFSKKHPQWEENLRRFNRGLHTIKNNGILNKLMQVFGISVPHERP